MSVSCINLNKANRGAKRFKSLKSHFQVFCASRAFNLKQNDAALRHRMLTSKVNSI